MVTSLRRALAALGVLLVSAVAALLGFASPASAVPCDTYPPSTCYPTILVSQTNPYVGDTIEISGQNFYPNEQVKLYIEDVYVGAAQTDASGNFDPPAVVPDRPGPAVVKGVGATGKADDVATTDITIRTRANTATDGGGNGLSNTGVKVAGLGVVAALLIAAGAFLTRAGKRRGTTSH